MNSINRFLFNAIFVFSILFITGANISIAAPQADTESIVFADKAKTTKGDNTASETTELNKDESFLKLTGQLHYILDHYLVKLFAAAIIIYGWVRPRATPVSFYNGLFKGGFLIISPYIYSFITENIHVLFSNLYTDNQFSSSLNYILLNVLAVGIFIQIILFLMLRLPWREEDNGPLLDAPESRFSEASDLQSTDEIRNLNTEAERNENEDIYSNPLNSDDSEDRSISNQPQNKIKPIRRICRD